jgi:hypothetical protein
MRICQVTGYYKQIRPVILPGLICFLLVLACSDRKQQEEIMVEWREGKATGVVMPFATLNNINTDSIQHLIQIRLAGNEGGPSVLGHFENTGETVIFRPVLPFTRGLLYKIYLRDRLLDTILIPRLETGNLSRVLAIFPRLDTLPSNLLKFYIEFSGPMQQGQALDHILLLKDQTDTVRGAFLDLQPELWNKAGNILTLWFDPGRIKRDLQPNKTMGPPLLTGHNYQLIIDSMWRDANGDNLMEGYQLNFFTGKRDDHSPEVNSWKLTAPERGAKNALIVNFAEPLDYFLVRNGIHIKLNGIEIPGTILLDSTQKICTFQPVDPWQPGNYILEIESRLEDLSGNNLNRLFDEDTHSRTQKEQKSVFTKSFRIE